VKVAAVLLATLPLLTFALDNGLARTPPMGWLAWERFRCNIDCVNDPENCISEKLFMKMADLLVSEGYAAAGYKYLNLDDCWPAKTRDPLGRLQGDFERFPSGIKALGKYIHSKGLKFGIYEDYGTQTCGGYPGIKGSLELDANTFAEWEVDYVKLDGCFSALEDMDIGYPLFGHYLNKTGRPMVYSCSWPYYQQIAGMNPNYTAIVETCNLWRNFDDIDDSWASVETIIDYYAGNQTFMVPHAGPGHWNDPDMIIGGNFGLSYEQSKSQFALWAAWASPLLLSIDLRTIRKEYKAILQNRKIIAVNQDVLGIQGKRCYKRRGIEIWERPITPVVGSDFSYAMVFLNRRTDGTPVKITASLSALGLDQQLGYLVEDLYSNKDYGILLPESKIKVNVNPTGCVILKFTLASSLIAHPSNHQDQYYQLPSNFQLTGHHGHLPEMEKDSLHIEFPHGKKRKLGKKGQAEAEL